MNELQELISGNIRPEQICVEQLLALAQNYSSPISNEYKLLEISTNILLNHYLKQAQSYL